MAPGARVPPRGKRCAPGNPGTWPSPAPRPAEIQRRTVPGPVCTEDPALPGLRPEPAPCPVPAAEKSRTSPTPSCQSLRRWQYATASVPSPLATGPSCAHGDFSPYLGPRPYIAKATDPVCGSAASRGILAAGWLGRFPIWRRTRCALADNENAGHVVIRLLGLRHNSSLRSRGNQGSLVPEKRNRQRAGGRHNAAANAGQTCPREGRTQAGDTQANMPRSCGHGVSRRNVAVDVSHVGHLPPGASVTGPRTCRQPT